MVSQNKKNWVILYDKYSVFVQSQWQNQTNSAKLYIVCVLEQKYDNGTIPF